MAVCGRCLICGYKFNGKLDDGFAHDEAVRWACTTVNEHCDRSRRIAAEHGYAHEHAICTKCHGGLVDGTLEGAVKDLVVLLATRSDT